MSGEVSGARAVLVTGFAPFAGDAVNPSGDVLPLVEEMWPGPERLVTAVLPVAFGAAGDRVAELVAAHRPDVVVALGLAAGRPGVTPERVAVNLDDARIPDNDGAQPLDAPVVAGAPAAYFSTLPVKAAVAALLADGVPAALSHTAGSFVCNHVFYRLQHDLAGSDVRSGFVHVPGYDVVARPDLARGVVTLLRTVLDVRDDLGSVGGIVA
ncbi:pyroglutamyl-peptidase I [Nocardioides zeae]|uniref:Pyroglutamyl-peptidase I n=1 Tax=Nocardioides imazamoxiresistens TaxID=3231893 RepID=A0ABU3PVD7_9ACTN|nr:pyroglutamyl-peptidase I [Nocardioides zeae]MDT9593164.1 pyroglutamyl-peptidase I [Nocardioides zeae]